MKLGYKRLGDYIQLVDERNRNLEVTNLLGISVTKNFIPSVANIVGTDMANYKIVRKNQFACSIMQVRRDKKMPVALYLEGNPSIISQAYPIFQIIDESTLLPEYLMMWFTRSEFDREACFLAVGGVRGSLEWEDFLNMQLPIPSPEKQKELIEEYEAIENRIQLNKKLCATLEETAQTIYKHWFEDFEFPVSRHCEEEGTTDEAIPSIGYKSSGGEMLECEELGKEIPKGWNVGSISDLIEVKDGTHDSPNPTDYGFPLITSTHLREFDLDYDSAYLISEVDFISINKRSKVEKFDILYSMIGTIGSISFIIIDEINFAIKNVGLFKTSAKENIAIFVLFYLKSYSTRKQINEDKKGSTQNYVTLSVLRNLKICYDDKVIRKFNMECKSFIEKINLVTLQTQKLEELKSLLLGKMAVEV